jgi:hypothetical protein
MLPADTVAEIAANLAALHLEPNTTAQILAAVFAPLLRSSEPELPPPAEPRSGKLPERPRSKPRKAPRHKRKKTARRATPNMTGRARARAALQANADATLTDVAKAVGCSCATVANARADLAREARKPRKSKTSPAADVLAKQTERRERAQQWLRQQLADGPQRVSDIEAAAEKAHLDQSALERAPPTSASCPAAPTPAAAIAFRSSGACPARATVFDSAANLPLDRGGRLALAAHDRVTGLNMDKETIQQIATEVVAQLPFGARYSVVYGVVTILIAGLGVWLGSFLKTKGQNFATKQDFNELQKQLKANTELIETIKSEVSQRDWAQREWTNLRRTKLEELMEKTHDCLAFLDQLRVRAVKGEFETGERDPVGPLNTMANSISLSFELKSSASVANGES